MLRHAEIGLLAIDTEPGQVRARSSSPEAERMRLYRKRRREGMRYVRIPLHVTEVDALRIGRLKEDSRTDAEVLQAAVLSLVYRGKLSNVNLGGDLGISHIAIDKNPKIQGEIERAILAVSQTK